MRNKLSPNMQTPTPIADLNQKGLLERAFHDGLFPNLAYRSEALPEQWEANTGTEIFMSRPGLLRPKVVGQVPGTDPTPQAIPFEQWSAKLEQFTDSIDVHMPTSVTSNADIFLRSVHQLGLQAGQSINRVARNTMFKSYLSGRTNTTAAVLSTDTMIPVAALNGFTDVINPTTSARPNTVSSAYSLAITIGTGASKVTKNVIGFIPNDISDPDGPGLLVLSTTVGGSGFAARTPVVSTVAPLQIMSSGGSTIDSISSSDTLTLQQVINAVAQLRKNNVQPHDDGMYHAHVSPLSNAQFFADPVFQRLNQSLPEGATYSQGFLGHISGVSFFANNESPETENSGSLISTGTSAYYANEIGSEVINNSGVAIGSVLITGKGGVYEKWLDESNYVSEAGITGKIGQFDVVNNGINILTERIRLIMRAPLNRLQDKVSLTWSISTSFPIPSDITAPGGTSRFRRMIVLRHAL